MWNAKPGDFVYYSIFTYATKERPVPEGHGWGHTDYFYGEVLSIQTGADVGNNVARIRCVDGEIDHTWVRSIERKVSLLEMIAAAADDSNPRELMRKGFKTLAMRLATQ